MADILWENVVGATNTIDDGGFMGDLLTVARAHVDDAVATNRLTQAQAGEIYTAMIPAAMNGAIQFVLDEQVKEAQISDVVAGTAIKEAELIASRDITEATLEKQWGYGVTRDVGTDALILGDSTDTGKIDSDIRATDASTALSNTKATEAVLEGTSARELRGQQTLTEVESTELTREKKESEEKQNVAGGVIDTQLDKMAEDIALAYTDRVIKDKQAAALGMDDVILVSREAKTGTTVYTPYYTGAV